MSNINISHLEVGLQLQLDMTAIGFNASPVNHLQSAGSFKILNRVDTGLQHSCTLLFIAVLLLVGGTSSI